MAQDIHTDVLLSHAGVAYPPTQETTSSEWHEVFFFGRFGLLVDPTKRCDLWKSRMTCPQVEQEGSPLRLAMGTGQLRTMAAVYGASPPQLPPGQPGEAVHLSASEQMETRHYDITNTCARLLCCCLDRGFSK